MRSAAAQGVAQLKPPVGVRCLRTLLDTIGGEFNVLFTGSHLHGGIVLETLMDRAFWARYGSALKFNVVGVFTDDPINRPAQCKVDRRSWSHYEGKDLVDYASIVPKLAQAHRLPVCYDPTDSEEGRKFVAGLRTEPNTVMCCCYHAWLPRWLRQMCGERSGEGGRCFNIHPNDEDCNMIRMKGTKPFTEVLTGPDRGMRMSLLRAVGDHWDHPDYVLQSTRLLDWPEGLKGMEPNLRFQIAYQHTARLVRELLCDYLVIELLRQLCAQNKVRIGGRVPQCPAPLYR